MVTRKRKALNSILCEPSMVETYLVNGPLVVKQLYDLLASYLVKKNVLLFS